MTGSGNTQCAHPKCTCAISEGGQYCSPVCQKAASSNTIDVQSPCGCPHPACKGHAHAAP